MKRDTIVVDLDGTLCDVGHRRRLVSGKKRDYPAFHALLDRDPVNHWCRVLMYQMKSAGYQVMIVSARPAYCLGPTDEWLRHNAVSYSDIFLLRGDDNDSTPAWVLKREWVKTYGADRILFAIDDNPKVTAMFKKASVACLYCGDDEEAVCP